MIRRVTTAALLLAALGLPAHGGLMTDNCDSPDPVVLDVVLVAELSDFADDSEFFDFRIVDRAAGIGVIPSPRTSNPGPFLATLAVRDHVVPPGLSWPLTLANASRPPSPVLEGLLKPS